VDDASPEVFVFRDRRLRLEGGWLDLDRGVFTTAEEAMDLSAIEIKLLEVLLARGGQPVSRDDLHLIVWGYSPKILTRAADQAVKRLRKKLEEDPSSPVHLQTSHGIGYRFVLTGSSRSRPVDAPFPRQGCPTNLLGRAGLLLGRQQIISQLDAWWESDRRLSILVGPGGIGKTSVARMWGAQLSERASGLVGGVWLCDLVGLELYALMMSRVARDLGMRIDGTVDEHAMGQALHLRGPTLLILDNVEQLGPKVGGLLLSWLQEAPGLRILCTSRVRMGLAEECCIEVPPLDQTSTSTLLSQHVRRASDQPQAAADLARLVESLEGNPLAIELAAARCSLLTLSELHIRLGARLDVLSRVGGDEEQRHSSLRASLSLSWSLLEEHERDLLWQATVFKGGFDLQAAEAVLVAQQGTPSVLDTLQRLRDHSLLSIIPGALHGRTRVTMLASVADYAEEQFPDADLHAVRARHGQCFADRAEATWATDGPGTWCPNAPLLPDLENFQAAAERCGAMDDELAVRVLTGLSVVLYGQGRDDEVLASARQAVLRASGAESISPELHSRAWCRLGEKSWTSLADNEGERAFREGIALADDAGCHRISVLGRRDLVRRLYSATDLAPSWQLVDEAMKIAQTHLPELLPLVNGLATRLHAFAGDLDQAEILGRRVLKNWQRLGHRDGVANAQYTLGYLALQRADYHQAELGFQAAIEALDETGQGPALFVLLGIVAMERGELDRAAQIIEQSLTWTRVSGRRDYTVENLTLMGQIALLQERPEEALQHLEGSEALLLPSVRGGNASTQALLAAALAAAGRVEAAQSLIRQLRATATEADQRDLDVLLSIVAMLVDCAAGAPEAEARGSALCQTLSEGPPSPTSGTRTALKLLRRLVGEQDQAPPGA